MMSVSFKLQNVFMQTRANVYDKAFLDSWLSVNRQIAGKPGYKRFWEKRRSMFTAEFVDFMENIAPVKEPDPDFHPLGISREKSK